MYPIIMEEMSDRIFEQIQKKKTETISKEDILNVIKAYWKDKIAITWQIFDIDTVLLDLDHDQDFLSDEEKVSVLTKVFDKHDAEYGVSWETLRCTTEDELLRKNKTRISIEMP